MSLHVGMPLTETQGERWPGGDGYGLAPTAVASDGEERASARIIGVELKAQSLTTGENVELAMFACQIKIPTAHNLLFEVTLHTSQGDVTFGRSDRGARRVFLPAERGSLGEYASRLQIGDGQGAASIYQERCRVLEAELAEAKLRNLLSSMDVPQNVSGRESDAVTPTRTDDDESSNPKKRPWWRFW